MSGFHSIKRDSAHRIRAREAFDPQAHRRAEVHKYSEYRRGRRRCAGWVLACAGFAAALVLAWEPARDWRDVRDARGERRGAEAVEARRLMLASDAAFARESKVSDGRAALVVNNSTVAPFGQARQRPLAEQGGRTYRRQALRHAAVMQALRECGLEEVAEDYRARNAETLALQGGYLRRAGAQSPKVPPETSPEASPVSSQLCGSLAEGIRRGSYDLTLD